jgi:hypothetical protein
MSAELEALGVMRGRAEEGAVSKTVVSKMLRDNPAKLYGI